MGRPSIVPFTSLTDTGALEGATSIVKAERTTTISAICERMRKRVTVETADEVLFCAKIRAALDTLVANGKITITGDAVALVIGKRGRPAGSKKVATATATA